MKWWLISEDDIAIIRVYLLVMSLAGDNLATDALHTLDSGLNATDEVPDDWKEEMEAA